MKKLLILSISCILFLNMCMIASSEVIEDISDGTNDVHENYRYNDWDWDKYTTEKPYMDITNVKYELDGKTVTLSMSLKEDIDRDEKNFGLTIWLKTVERDYVIYVTYTPGEPEKCTLNIRYNGEYEYIDDVNYQINGNTFSATFELYEVKDFTFFGHTGIGTKYYDEDGKRNRFEDIEWADFAPDEQFFIYNNINPNPPEPDEPDPEPKPEPKKPYSNLEGTWYGMEYTTGNGNGDWTFTFNDDDFSLINTNTKETWSGTFTTSDYQIFEGESVENMKSIDLTIQSNSYDSSYNGKTMLGVYGLSSGTDDLTSFTIYMNEPGSTDRPLYPPGWRYYMMSMSISDTSSVDIVDDASTNDKQTSVNNNDETTDDKNSQNDEVVGIDGESDNNKWEQQAGSVDDNTNTSTPGFEIIIFFLSIIILIILLKRK